MSRGIGQTRQMRVARSLYLALFALTASLGVVFALLARLQEEVGFGNAALGPIAGAAFFSSVAAQLGLAPLADRGRARSLLLSAVVAAALGSFWIAFAGSVWELVAARLLAGLGIGTFQPAARAVVAAIDPSRAGARLGRLTAVETTGFVAGPVIGAAAQQLWGLDAPFILLGVLTVAVIPGLIRMPLPVLAGGATERRWVVTRQVLGRREAAAAVLLGGALFLPAGMYEAIWARFMADLGASTLFVGISLTMYGIPFAITAAVAGGYIDRVGPRRAMRVALIVIVPLTIIYGQLRSPWILITLAMIEAVGNGLGLPASQTAMAAVTGPGERATGQGLVAAAGQIGAGVAALLAAPLYAGPGPGATFATVALLVAVLGVIGLRLSGERPVRAA